MAAGKSLEKLRIYVQDPRSLSWSLGCGMGVGGSRRRGIGRIIGRSAGCLTIAESPSHESSLIRPERARARARARLSSVNYLTGQT